MLQVVFGDDEHTAAEGPYRRLMKTRKWLYLASAAGVLLGFGLYKEATAAEVIGIIALPAWLLEQSLLFGLAYLLLIYAMLCVQLRSTYDLVLNERFVSRRAEQLDSARNSVGESERRHVELLNNWNSTRGLTSQRPGPPAPGAPRRTTFSEVQEAELELNRAHERYLAMLRAEPVNRPGYKKIEIAIDLVRLGLAPTAAIYALMRLTILHA